MSLFARIKTRFQARAKALVSGALSWAGVNWTGDVISALNGAGGRNAQGWLSAFRTCTQLRAPVNRIAEDVAAVPFWLKRRIPGQIGLNGKVPATIVHESNANAVEAWILQLLRQPNPRMTGTRFRWLVTVYLETVGYAPILIEWETVRLNGQKIRFPKALKPIAPHRLLSIPTQGKPFFRVAGARGQGVDYPAGDVIWLNVIDVLDPYGLGCGAAAAVDDEVSQITYAGIWNNNFYRQGAHPGTVVALDGVSPESKKMIQAEWESKYTGIHNAWRTLFVDGKVSAQNLSPSHKEQDFTATQQHLGDRLRFNWNMPPELLGDVRNSNRATIQGATQVHQQGNLAPRVLFWQEHLNAYLMPLFGDPDLFLEWANPVQSTEELQHQALTDGYQIGTVTRDQWLMGHQMDPLGEPWGNMLNVPLNMQGYSITDQPPAAAPQANMEAIQRVYSAAEALVRGDQGHRRGEKAGHSAGFNGLYRP